MFSIRSEEDVKKLSERVKQLEVLVASMQMDIAYIKKILMEKNIV